MAAAKTNKKQNLANDEAYLKLRDIIMMQKNKASLEMLKFWYTAEDAKILSAGPFKMVQVDQFTIVEYAEMTGSDSGVAPIVAVLVRCL